MASLLLFLPATWLQNAGLLILGADLVIAFLWVTLPNVPMPPQHMAGLLLSLGLVGSILSAVVYIPVWTTRIPAEVLFALFITNGISECSQRLCYRARTGTRKVESAQQPLLQT